jgi:hypothetical protein
VKFFNNYRFPNPKGEEVNGQDEEFSADGNIKIPQACTMATFTGSLCPL